VIIHHADRLHQRVADGRADKGEAKPLEIAAQQVRRVRPRGHLLQPAPRVLPRRAVYVAPQKGIERTVRLLDIEHAARVADRGVDLEPVAHNAGVGQQTRRVGLAVPGDTRDVEAVERRAVVLAFAQDRQPTQSGLCALEDQELEQPPVVMQRNAPLAVVVRLIQRVAAAPGAADRARTVNRRAGTPSLPTVLRTTHALGSRL